VLVGEEPRRTSFENSLVAGTELGKELAFRGRKSSSSSTGGAVAVAAGPFTFEDDNIKYGAYASPDSSPRAMRRTGEGATPVYDKVMEVRP
jgi:hypothetical protein